jgi:hypothetical protein
MRLRACRIVYTSDGRRWQHYAFTRRITPQALSLSVLIQGYYKLTSQHQEIHNEYSSMPISHLLPTIPRYFPFHCLLFASRFYICCPLGLFLFIATSP